MFHHAVPIGSHMPSFVIASPVGARQSSDGSPRICGLPRSTRS